VEQPQLIQYVPVLMLGVLAAAFSFDIEVVFLYPWAVIYRDMLKDKAHAAPIFGSMISFLAILFVGYMYALKKRAFDWKS
jgi:NADH-quinone oxidoreductase subunit A